MTRHWDSLEALELVRGLVFRELPPKTPMPSDEEDLVKTGLIDSMGWVAIVSAIEEAASLHNPGGDWPEDRAQSIRALVEALLESVREGTERTPEDVESPGPRTDAAAISLAGWGFVLGSLRVEAEEIERECGVAPGTFRDGAGIESVRRAGEAENELILAGKAAESALDLAKTSAETVDFVVVTSATFIGFPSLAASLHSRLLLPESCGAIDVGGACVGLVQGLAVAKALLASSRHGVALVIAAEVNSRRLSSPQVPGEFRGLFGDGACAFVLARSGFEIDNEMPMLGDFVWGCSGTFASSLRLWWPHDAEIEVQFKGEQLASTAVSTLEHTLSRLENLSGRSRSEASSFALHEPNPRIVEILARRAKIPVEKIPLVSRTLGNLGSATCGVSLCTALNAAQASGVPPARPLIFLAAVGPGLLWGGTCFQ